MRNVLGWKIFLLLVTLDRPLEGLSSIKPVLTYLPCLDLVFGLVPLYRTSRTAYGSGAPRGPKQHPK